MQTEIDGARFDVLDEGQGDVIVLLQGLGLNKKIWDELAPKLVASGRVIRFDLRGMGTTQATPGPYDDTRLANDILSVLDSVGVRRAVIVGHSYLCGPVIAFANAHPDRVSGIALLNGTGGGGGAASARELSQLADAVDRQGIEVFIAALGSRLLGATTRREQPEQLGRVTALMRDASPAGISASLRGMAKGVSYESTYPSLKLPVLVAASEEDELQPVALLRSMAVRIPNVMFEVLPGGHIPQVEAPAPLLATLQRLVRKAAVAPDDC